MNIYIYSDESGVFDYAHNSYFVFGGLICFGEAERDAVARKYARVEMLLRATGRYGVEKELKASRLSNKHKGKLFRSLNGTLKFCVLIRQKELRKEIFENKKHKQRYLDYAYKIVLKKCFEFMIDKKRIDPDRVQNIFVNADEHSTATDGRYELRENLLNEFKNGTFNFGWDCYFEPIFKNLFDVDVRFRDSSKTRLVRAADIVANHWYHCAVSNQGYIEPKANAFIYVLPGNYASSFDLHKEYEPRPWIPERNAPPAIA